MIWWEDFKVGDVTEMGRHTFTEEEIVAFGREYDPQLFHVDAAAAKAGPFGGLIASGWQVCAVLVKHLWEAVNQNGELVLTLEGWAFFGRRPGAAEA